RGTRRSSATWSAFAMKESLGKHFLYSLQDLRKIARASTRQLVMKSTCLQKLSRVRRFPRNQKCFGPEKNWQSFLSLPRRVSLFRKFIENTFHIAPSKA